MRKLLRQVLGDRWQRSPLSSIPSVAALALLASIALEPAALAAPRPRPLQAVAAPADQAPPQAATSDQGELLIHRGAYAEAASLYAGVAAQATGDAAVRALLSEARAALEGGDPPAAQAAAEGAIARFGSSAQTADAWFLRAEAQRQAGNCGGALDSLAAYESAAGPTALGPYLALQRAACYGSLQNWSGELAAAQTALSIENGGPRLARIEGYERASDAATGLGQPGLALDMANKALDLAGTRAYRAEMLYRTGSLLRTLGQNDEATQRFRTVVVDLPEQRRAPDALDALNELGTSDTISNEQAGIVRLDAGMFSRAAGLFAQVDPGSPEAGPAGVNHAIALLRQGQESAAISELEKVADAYPAQAGTALLRAGGLHEGDGELNAAEADYLRIGARAPGTEQAAQGLIRASLVRYTRHDTSGAVDALHAALDPALGASPSVRAQVLLWLGKLLASTQPGDAAAAWTEAATIATDSFYGLRAADFLNGAPSPVAGPGSLQTGLANADQQELTAWLQTRALDPASLQAEINLEPGSVRADHLLALDLTDEAGWEIDALQARYVDGRDLPRLWALGEWLSARDLPSLTLQVGLKEQQIAGGLSVLPRALQRQSYPAGWADVASEVSATQGVDPTLLLGLVRQESSFNRKALSRVGAVGLTQVMPATGQSIAQRLGVANSFSTGDLYRPAVSLQFGASYLSGQLARYSGHIFPTLAAYNAGGGSVDPWLATWGSDPDLFSEEIPFQETRDYVQIVYRNYRLYQRLYGR